MVKFMLEVSIGGEGGGVIGDINSYYYLYIGHRQIPPPIFNIWKRLQNKLYMNQWNIWNQTYTLIFILDVSIY